MDGLLRYKEFRPHNYNRLCPVNNYFVRAIFKELYGITDLGKILGI